MRAAAVGAVFEAEHLGQTQRVQVHLPTCGGVSSWGLLEDLGEALAPNLHLPPGPFEVRAAHTVLPPRVIPAVQTDFKAFIADKAHDITSAAPDVRTREKRAVEQRLYTVVLDDR